MNLLLRGVHMDLDDSLRAYVEEHLVRAITRVYDDTAAELEVHLVDVNGPKGGVDKECRVTFRPPHFSSVHVTERGADIYACVDLARDRLEKAVKRELERMRDSNKDGGARERRATTTEAATAALELPDTQGR